MGVRGLTTFIANRSERYLENHQLSDTNLVLDGFCIACQLYKWHCKRNDCFGGDYDKYRSVVEEFFQMLKACNITPFIVFDGGYEKRKMRTVFSRMKDRIQSANNLCGATEGSVSVFPLLVKDVFIELAIKNGIKCVRCEFEADSETACLARSLNCPVLSYDSDFYIFDVMYIPFSTMDLRVRKKNGKNYMACQVYYVDKFLESFGGMDKINLPVLAVLLGNDYVKKNFFAAFYRHLKLQKGGNNEQQRCIKTLITWLKNETPETAIMKVVGRFKLAKRRSVTRKIESAIKGYHFTSSEMLEHFNIVPEAVDLRLPKIEDIEALPEVEEDQAESMEEEAEAMDEDDEALEDEAGAVEEEAEALEEEEAGSEDIQIDKETEKVDMEKSPVIEMKERSIKVTDLPEFFRNNFRNCFYPGGFIDMITTNTYYCTPQVEDSAQIHSHNLSLNIISACHKILTDNSKSELRIVGRQGKYGIKKFTLPLYEKDLPSLRDLENLPLETCKTIFLDILNIDDSLGTFPQSWQLLIIAIKYWIKHTKANLSSVYSILLCAIVLNYVDQKLGFYRSTKPFLNRYESHTSRTAYTPQSSIAEALDSIDFNDSVASMKKLIHYFQMDFKMKTSPKLFDRTIVHEFAVFQSCLLHIKFLNSLLKFPFPQLEVSQFYDGTFLYNMTVNLNKRTDMDAYVKILLGSCPRVLNGFELMVAEVKKYAESCGMEERRAPKRRRRKKKAKEEVLEELGEVKIDSGSDGGHVDENNRFHLLSKA